MKKAWEMMKILNVVTLPVVNKKDKLEGLIAVSYTHLDVYKRQGKEDYSRKFYHSVV